MTEERERVGAKTTVSIDAADAPLRVQAVPGAVLIFAESLPQARVFRTEADALELGRSELAVGASLDSLISRKHVRLSFEQAHWRVTDLESRNGTFVNGQRISGERRAPMGSILRVGGALVLLVADIVPFEHYGLGARDGVVGGPSLRRALEAVVLGQSPGSVVNLLITGATGTGKELAAQAFHRAGSRAGSPFTAVNCATIPKELAERLLFGSRRGAFSGATDCAGHVQSAHGGTLFLDEIAELPLDVQSKLLRMLETREVLRLGATTYEAVEVRVCAATWRNLRALVSAGQFREDLYFRIGQPEVHLPSLRDRLEEIPWHVQQVIDELCSSANKSLSANATFLEACAFRAWPGNVRELRGEVRRAANAAIARGSSCLSADDLSETAGMALASVASEAAHGRPVPSDEVAAALLSEGGNVASAARRLGVHRNKIRRWLERHQLAARSFKAKRETFTP